MNNEEFQKIVLKELNGIKSDISTIKSDVSSLKSDVDTLKENARLHRLQTTENTQILQALMHASEFQSAENNKTTIDVAHIKGDVIALKENLSNVETLTASNYTDIVRLKAIR